MSSLRIPALSLLTTVSSKMNVKYIASLWSADCESSIVCFTPVQAYLHPLALGVACRPVLVADSCSPFAEAVPRVKLIYTVLYRAASYM